MLKQRIITALLLGPLVLAIVIWGDKKWFMALTAVIQVASVYEWLKMNRLPFMASIVLAVIVTAGSCYFAHLMMVTPGFAQHYVLIAFGLVWVVALLWLWQFKLGHENRKAQLFLKAILGTEAIALFAIAFLMIRVEDQGQWWALILLLTIWVADVGAYFSGKTFGKNKLAINISPGKTWEGVIGAQLFVIGFALMVSHYMPIDWQTSLWVFPLVALFSVVGDLAASLGKRQAGIKDSSNLLPGHGGFIDRFDSLIAAAPLYYMLLFVL
ncbi:phosphatidate cytidylyltransferase [Marinicella rhabdoformis]|uniref:phosphatidate cytidylyltransferase n=1 Tax=Marinicella rhabdoformis TaxID=2580566 RepID=UPI0012AEDBB1|nr:phosphatidate cytidylyltransferase [Marinicella rhabdoformis]